ncbi:unnamed protein product [Peniophora sp. CBMAI 1063]|nr:unnamed protein product [Peniophora sp. CBMAI 1063]
MFSLGKVATFALFVLGVAASAVPTKRQESAVEILDKLASDVSPIAAKFASMTPATANVFAVQGVVAQIKPLVSEASTKIAALPRGSADKTATIKSLANVFNAILQPSHKLVTTPGVNAVTIIPIFTQLGATLAALLANVVTLVEELLTAVVGILQGLITGLDGILGNLGLTGLTAGGF